MFPTSKLIPCKSNVCDSPDTFLCGELSMLINKSPSASFIARRNGWQLPPFSGVPPSSLNPSTSGTNESSKSRSKISGEPLLFLDFPNKSSKLCIELSSSFQSTDITEVFLPFTFSIFDSVASFIFKSVFPLGELTLLGTLLFDQSDTLPVSGLWVDMPLRSVL